MCRRQCRRVDRATEKLPGSLRVVCNPTRNFQSLRKLLKRSRPPTVPYIGLLLQDLTFVNEGSSKKVEIGGNTVINWQKFVNFTRECVGIEKYRSKEYEHTSDSILQMHLKNDVTLIEKMKDKNVRELVKGVIAYDLTQATKAEKRELESGDKKGGKKGKKPKGGLFKRLRKY